MVDFARIQNAKPVQFPKLRDMWASGEVPVFFAIQDISPMGDLRMRYLWSDDKGQDYRSSSEMEECFVPFREYRDAAIHGGVGRDLDKGRKFGFVVKDDRCMIYEYTEFEWVPDGLDGCAGSGPVCAEAEGAVS